MTRRRRPRTSEERLVAAVGSVARGVAGGRIRNIRQAAALERNTGPGVAAGALGADADPVIIGLDATSLGAHSIAIGYLANGGNNSSSIAIGARATTIGSFADAVSSGIAIGDQATVTHNLGVAVGPSATAGATAVAIGEATATGGDSIAIGDGATATDMRGIAIGFLAATPVTDALAIGPQATASGQTSIALGSQVVASGLRAVAIGDSASAAHSHATALGAGATTTAANQVVLGTSADTVILPGQLQALTLPTTDPGASGRVWNNAGVVTVSP